VGHHCVAGGGDAETAEAVGVAFCGVEAGGDEDLWLVGWEGGTGFTRSGLNSVAMGMMRWWKAARYSGSPILSSIVRYAEEGEGTWSVAMFVPGYVDVLSYPCAGSYIVR